MHKIYFIRIKNKLIFYLAKARLRLAQATRFNCRSRKYITQNAHSRKKFEYEWSLHVIFRLVKVEESDEQMYNNKKNN